MDGRDYPLQGVDQAITYAYTPAGEAAPATSWSGSTDASRRDPA